jgi:hypothetical protein
MTEILPAAITTYLEAADPGRPTDLDILMSVFAADAAVTDEGKTYRGDEIRAWREHTATEYTYTVELVGTEQIDDDHYVVTNHLEGDFPGGQVDLKYRFALSDNLITTLEIAP